MCPLPVAAKLPNKVTLKHEASGCLAKNCSAAFLGPIVWLLDGPQPILNMFFMLSICGSIKNYDSIFNAQGLVDVWSPRHLRITGPP
jgi:hypothetical protein